MILCLGRFFTFFGLILASVSTPAQYPNVLISGSNNPNEPSICINPKNPNQVVAGANNDNYYYSNDGGLTWSEGIISSSFGVWGDPVIIVDTSGAFYYFHLSVPSWPQWLDRIVCQKSHDGGHSWSDGSFMGLNGTKAQDKEWAVIDPSNNHIYCCWTQFDAYGSPNPADSTVILFSRSTDNGSIWSTPKRINRLAGDCLDQDNTVEGAVPVVGPNGEIYTSWAGPSWTGVPGIFFTRSLDGGLTWPDTNIVICDMPGGWDFAIPGIYRANGMPVTCCDLSNGPHRGTIYVNWSDQRNGPDDTDIWISKSTDGGLTWSAPIRVNNDPPGKQQFFTWMAIDQTTGFLYAVFYDRRDYSGNMTDVYMAVSRDGGNTFDNFRISESPFLPDPAVFFGDYNNISVHNNIVRPIWTRLDGGNLSIWTAMVDSINVVIPEQQYPLKEPFTLDQNYPNPVTDVTCFSFKIHETTRVSLKIFNLLGVEVASLLDDQLMTKGKYIQRFDANQLPPGIYYFSLINREQTLKRKMIVE